MPTWALWLACLGLLLLRALLAAAESALYGTSELRAKELAKDFPGPGGRVLRQRTDREATAAAIRTGMVLSGFLAAAMGALAPERLVDLSRPELPDWIVVASPMLGAFFVGVVAALMDVTARAVAGTGPNTWALRLSPLVSFAVLSLYPVMRLLVALLNLVVRPFGGRVRFESPPPPLAELEKLLAAQAANAQVDKGAPQLIHSIFELSDKRCKDVMVPRTDAVCLELGTPTDEIVRLLAEESHSRMPVYRDDVDHIVGVLHARDLIPMLQHPELIVLGDTLRPAHFVPWVKPIGDLLREMQKKKIHMAIVVDEHGGFMGIVTLEDILREIVGDIRDEFAVDEKELEKQLDGSYVVAASMEVGEFAKAVGLTLPEGTFETVGGLMSSLRGAIPDIGEKVLVSGWQLVVQAKEGPRLHRIRASRLRTTSKG